MVQTRLGFKPREIDRALGLRPGQTQRLIKQGKGPRKTEIGEDDIVLVEDLSAWLAKLADSATGAPAP